jgi:hypothetical protein
MWKIQQLGQGVRTTVKEDDFDGDGMITDSDVKAGLALVLAQRQIRTTADYCAEHPTPPAGSNITAAQWKAYCAWNETEEKAKLADAIRELNLRTALNTSSSTIVYNDLTAEATNYSTGIVNVNAQFLDETAKMNGIRTVSESFGFAVPSEKMTITRVLDLSFLPKNMVSITSPPEVVGQAIDISIQNFLDSIAQANSLGHWVAPTRTQVTVQNNFLEALNKYKAEVGIPTDVKANTLSENSYLLIEGNNFGQMRTGQNATGSSSSSCSVRLKYSNSDSGGQESSISLLPATGDWASSWSNNGIYAFVPSLSGMRWTGQPVIEVTRTGPDGSARAEVSITKDLAIINALSSNPDYRSLPVIPKAYSSITAVAGGELLIMGSNFGTETGQIQMILDKPLQAYENDQPNIRRDPATILSQGKIVPLKVLEWSDKYIRVSVGEIRANFGGQIGMITITKAGKSFSVPHLVYLSPKWVKKQFSGFDYFSPDLSSSDNRDGLFYERRDGFTYVSHDPRCAGLKSIGDNGNDQFFGEKTGSKMLPKNVHFENIFFLRVDPNDQSKVKFIADFCMMAMSMAQGNIVSWGKFAIMALGMLFDENWGSYVAKPSLDISYPSLLDSHLPFEVHWENSCVGLYDDQNLVYTASFVAWVPEGVSLGV